MIASLDVKIEVSTVIKEAAGNSNIAATCFDRDYKCYYGTKYVAI